MGGRFWIALIASIAGISIAAGIVFLLVGAAIIAWGVLGAFVVIAGVALAIAWVYDRRRAQVD